MRAHQQDTLRLLSTRHINFGASLPPPRPRCLHRQQARKAFFVFLWACTTASCTTPLINCFPCFPSKSIGPTNYCIGSLPPPYVGVTVIIPFFNDTVSFLSLAWRLQDAAYVHGKEKVISRSFNLVAGRYLPRLSRALLQNGQAYFLCVK